MRRGAGDSRPATRDRRPALALLALLAACWPFSHGPKYPTAHVVLTDLGGQQIAKGTLSQTPDGVQVRLLFDGAPPGVHGLHVHTVGSCELPQYMSAGMHFNPARKQHGLKNAAGPHAGDMPNVTISDGGTGKANFLLRGVTIGPGAASLLQPGGAAIVLHAGRDDEITDPAGNSGARIACGVITADK